MRLVVKSLLVVVVAGLAGNSLAGIYSGGSGTEGVPYQIGTAEDIIEMSNEPNDWDDHFLMIADVNMVDYTFTTAVIAPDTDNTNTSFEGEPFTGVLDGGEYKIRNLSIYTEGAGNNHLGLFGFIVGEQAQVKNLGLENVSIIGGDDSIHLGCLVGNCINSTISNCYATGSVSGDGVVGGLIGKNVNSVILNCYATGSVSGGFHGNLGGLVGWIKDEGEVINCYSSCSVSGQDSSEHLGGLCGKNGGTISDCYATGSVNAGEQSRSLGGLCGENNDTIINCYATGSINGYWNVGGLCGYNDHYGTIRNCYSIGFVTGLDHFGGFCGGSNDATFSNCFWDIDASGTTDGVGNMYFDPIDVTGKTTSEMMTLSTFTDAGWDFIDIWDIGENQTYPYLRIVPGSDINKDRITNLLDFVILSENWLEED